MNPLCCCVVVYIGTSVPIHRIVCLDNWFYVLHNETVRNESLNVSQVYTPSPYSNDSKILLSNCVAHFFLGHLDIAKY